MKKTIKDYEIKGKKVIIRCDFNVPMENGKILDDYRIIQTLPTIKYAVSKGAKIILLSHLGRIENEVDKLENSLKPVAEKLTELLHKEVQFIPKTRCVENAIKKMKNKDIILLENTRFEDIPDKKESNNDEELGKYWASLGNIFINDAFGTSHRAHASNVGIASNIKSGIGLLASKEIKALKKLNKPKKPYIVILGGAKVEDKLPVITNLIQKADYILIGGRMAYTFLNASGFSTGANKICTSEIDTCIKLLSDYESKIILPIDYINETKEEKFINEITDDEIGLDIGKTTTKVFKQYIQNAKTIFWNGPLGYFENPDFARGTKEILEAISNTDAVTIIGGGDSASAAINMGYKDKITHISTGGGASLKLLEGKELPAIQIIDEK